MPTLTPVSCPPHSTARRPRPGGCRFGRAWRDRRPCDVPGRLHDGLEGGLGACQAQGARGGQELAEGRALRDACFLTRMAGISRPVTCALYAAELSLLPWRSGSTLSVRRRSKGRRGSRSSQPTVASKGGRPGLFDLSLLTATLPSTLPPVLLPAQTAPQTDPPGPSPHPASSATERTLTTTLDGPPASIAARPSSTPVPIRLATPSSAALAPLVSIVSSQS
jgi:hypothetical protein